MLTGENIRRRLVDFARRWSMYSGTERAEAQTFLNELFQCYGTDRRAVGARFEAARKGRFLDLIWERRCIIEMKRPRESGRLAQHRAQAFDYWRKSADKTQRLPAPRFVVLCAFTRLEIWEPGAYPNEPRATFNLVELPEHVDALMFLAEREPVFVESRAAVTRKAAALMTDIYHDLADRRAAGPDTLRDFLLQAVWSLFAENLGQIEGYLFTRIVDDLIANPRRSSADDLGGLFAWLGHPGPHPTTGIYTGTRYVNGALFAHPAQVPLEQSQLLALRAACEYDWHKVEPHIFSTLLQGALGSHTQHRLGAHYTDEVDIQKVVTPSIVQPWRERIEDAGTLTQVRMLQAEMLNYVILDPACGSGNFLYIAYREMRRLELLLKRKEQELRLAAGSASTSDSHQSTLAAFFPLTNIKGLEVHEFAVKLSRVTLWIGHKLAVDELDLDETTLPLTDLSGIRSADALRAPWPTASVIIGNPPFHGDRNLRRIVGDRYIEWLKDEFGCGIKDHCVYWFRKAHDQLAVGGRAGLVGTNSITQNRARSASLNHIVENDGIITDAVSSQPWRGEANVHVSIVNWIRAPDALPTRFVLDGKDVEGIDSALRPSTIANADIPTLAANRGLAFQGFLPGAKYDITIADGESILARTDASYTDVVKPYLGGRDITSTIAQAPSRYIVDFAQLPLEQALCYPAALAIVESQAREARESSNSYGRNPRWWQFLWPRPEFRGAVATLPRFIVGTATSKRFLFTWCRPHWRPSNATNMFALASDYALGILTSSIHTDWALQRSSTFGAGPRYTPTSAFETFPWPQPNESTKQQIGMHAAAIVATRAALCSEDRIGLTELYNRCDDGAYRPLRNHHRALDRAVAAAYGWDPDLIGDLPERSRRLADMNAQIVAGRLAYRPF